MPTASVSPVALTGLGHVQFGHQTQLNQHLAKLISHLPLGKQGALDVLFRHLARSISSSPIFFIRSPRHPVTSPRLELTYQSA